MPCASRGARSLPSPDDEIMEAMNRTARLSAVFGEPSGAASVAGVKRAIADGIIKKTDSVCAVITGNGLKDIKAAIETARHADSYCARSRRAGRGIEETRSGVGQAPRSAGLIKLTGAANGRGR